MASDEGPDLPMFPANVETLIVDGRSGDVASALDAIALQVVSIRSNVDLLCLSAETKLLTRELMQDGPTPFSDDWPFHLHILAHVYNDDL